jgi:peroxiredoxin
MSESALLPDFEVQAMGNQRFQLAAGHPFVPYFHLRRDTPGCTSAGRQFRAPHPRFPKSP